MRSVSGISAAALAGALLLGACAARQDRPQVGPMIAEDAAASPVLYADQGLEVRWWIVSDRLGELSRVLAPYAERPTPADDETLARWERSGMRLVAVPLESLTDVRDALPKVGATNSQWLGESATWLDALGGPVLDRPWTLVVNDATATLPAGQLRLLVRAWMVPDLTSTAARAALHVEVMPQHRSEIASGELDERLLPVPTRYRTRDIDELLLTMNVGPGDALLIVPEQPGATWDDEPATAPDEIPIGPTPTYPTIGGAMLTGSPSGLGRAMNKAVIVLIPRVPERFELTAR